MTILNAVNEAGVELDPDEVRDIATSVIEYLRETVVVRSKRYRDMEPNEKYFLALHVQCERCGAPPTVRCHDFRTAEPTQIDTPHFERLKLGYTMTHLYQIVGLGYPEDCH